MLAKVFNTYSYTHTLSIESPENVDVRMTRVLNVSQELILNVFDKGELMRRIMDAQRDNDADMYYYYQILTM
jgi:hypothetical protein